MADTVTDASDAGIVVDAIARSFGSVHAVSQASFTVPQGSITGLVGPNGAGKTTLLLMLATLLQPDAGSIRIAGINPSADPAAVRSVIGWMPDSLGTWSSLSPRTALKMIGRMYNLDAQAAASRATELLDSVGLTPLADQPARVLSRGQKQRLSLARALIHEPRVLLLDEPASGLDPAARAELRSLLRHLADDGATVLISSHELAELEEISDAAVYMSGGVTASSDALTRAATSTRQWRIRSLDGASLRSALTGIGVAPENIAADNRGVLVSVTGEADAAQLLGALVTAGVAVTSFSPAVGEFEHTFLDLTQNAAADQHPKTALNGGAQ
ncbi:ABC transporter ATP-binding protein [Paramicrobacterium fandaimingii]|uniref:ABC transporter ATP-binding protein n=1 Tax=Paramicrobacterium fandaimingii TaxID=2708079 RepID=UPI001FD46C65|nr:ABC transporter ATP-binding protein [Microbacterium fandaimingii]